MFGSDLYKKQVFPSDIQEDKYYCLLNKETWERVCLPKIGKAILDEFMAMLPPYRNNCFIAEIDNTQWDSDPWLKNKTGL